MPIVFTVYFALLTQAWITLTMCIAGALLAGPATTSFYYVTNKVIRHDRGYVWEEFWHCFKVSFKQSVIVAEILTLIGLLLVFDCSIMYSFAQAGYETGSMYVVFLIFIALEVMWASYLFPYMARFENKTKIVLKNAALMAISYLPKTFLMFVVFVIFLVLICILPVLIIVLPVVYMLIAQSLLEKVFRKYMNEEDLIEEDERNGERY
jgi:uncharacterized membrane protein YesL